MENYNSWIKINLEEVEGFDFESHQSKVPPYIEIKRSLGFNEFSHLLQEITATNPLESGDGIEMTPIYSTVAEVKSGYLKADAVWLLSMGYSEIEFLELAPGDTSISYKMRGRYGK